MKRRHCHNNPQYVFHILPLYVAAKSTFVKDVVSSKGTKNHQEAFCCRPRIVCLAVQPLTTEMSEAVPQLSMAIQSLN